MSDYIPPDLWPDILANLPAEDVVRCSGVCKSWYSLITSSAFLSLHNQRMASLAKKNPLLLVRNYEVDRKFDLIDEKYSVHLDDDTFSEYKSLDLPFDYGALNFRILDCLNGVVCLTKTINRCVDDTILWNPSIRKYLRLPNPIVPLDNSQDMILGPIGFGFDSASNDFKVVRVLDYMGRKSGAPPHAEVCKLSEGCWRGINPVGLWGVSYFSYKQVFLQRAVHWLGRKCCDDTVLVIASFDIRNEVFNVMSMPEYSPDRRWSRGVYVSSMEESLSIIYFELSSPNAMFSIWVMKEYGVADSWTKQFTIDPCPARFWWNILCFRNNCEALLARCTASGPLYSYDPNRKHFIELKLFRNENYEVFNYMESLALFGVKGQHVMETKTEGIVISKGCCDVRLQKKMNIQASGDK